jgi:hypothetical protein
MDLELTLPLPCLEEADTPASCSRKGQPAVRERQIDGEVNLTRRRR